MKNPRIYQPITLGLEKNEFDGKNPNNIFSLDESGSHHIGKVLRMQTGDLLRIFNGQGGEYQACITEVSKKKVCVALTAFNSDNNNSPLDIHLAQVMSRGDRMDYVIQKAVELGVRSITPLTSARCEVRLNPQRQEKRLLQWQQQIISACEQCGLNIIPTINNCQSLEDFCETVKSDKGKKIILHPGHHQANEYFSQTAPEEVTVLIGPEGGFNDDEISLAQENGFDCLTLGPRVFRTETAPVAMLTLLQHYWGDL
ncbi:16S rRNA (uracil(1498)-N(3))-methyltransferase [Gammaproteobacteria bacterium 42_54_T18]|nr:16S rRNA (uracil(1498)-N(3))-methyltransferase [Gammaproteobacteria bacterium 42_54_T18]